MHRIIRIRREAGWDIPGELSHHRIDIYKYADGHYIAKFKVQPEMGKIVTIENELSTEVIEELLESLFAIKLPISPKYPMGCDMDYVEIEIKGFGTTSRFGWSGCPPDWEELEKITNNILVHAGFYPEDEE